MKYQNIPVEKAREIANEFAKDIVVICAWSHEHQLLHTTTYGKSPQDKISAGRGGEICAMALGTDISKKQPVEDFRTIDAAKNAQLRDLASGIVSALRSYQYGNSSADLAKEYADKLEAVLGSELKGKAGK